MANKKNVKKVNNNQKSKNNATKNSNQNKSVEKNDIKKKKTEVIENKKNSLIMKALVIFGVIIFCFIIVYLMYYFFVKESNIKVNMSTDKKMEYITLEGEQELIITQKYVSDLLYSMRYDINNFKVFKYKKQDIYKYLQDERVLVVVENSMLPDNCSQSLLETEYNNCYIKIDNYTEEYYISKQNKIYKITIKTPGTAEYEEGVKTRINFMLNTFEMN